VIRPGESVQPRSHCCRQPSVVALMAHSHVYLPAQERGGLCYASRRLI